MASRTAQTDSSKAHTPPADAVQQPAASSLALRFSDEIWLRTFAQLEYYALNKVQRVCKKFQRLVQVRPALPRRFLAALVVALG